jgi:transcription initiation factor TFIIIB Brf1 subunit/transcription initiation factor TFIIB
LEIAMKDYKRDSYKCEKCGEILKRDINDICSTFDTSKITGFFGKSK